MPIKNEQAWEQVVRYIGLLYSVKIESVHTAVFIIKC